MKIKTKIEIDNDIYNSLERYPKSQYYNTDVSDFCGYQILTIHLFPVQYIPASGRLFYYSRLTITMGLEQTDHISYLYRASSADAMKVKACVENPEIVNTYDLAIRGKVLFSNGLCDPSESYDYVLITNNALCNTYGYDYNWSELLEGIKVEFQSVR